MNTVSWSWTISKGQCDKCDHLAKSETRFYPHKKACNENMSNQTKKRGYSLFNDMMKSKSIELVKSLWQARKTEQKDLLECFDTLAEEVRDHNRENKRLNQVLTMAESIEKIVSTIEKPGLRRTDSDSGYNELIDGPREKKARPEDSAPGAGTPGGAVVPLVPVPQAQAPQALAPQSSAPQASAPQASAPQAPAEDSQFLMNYNPEDSARENSDGDGVTISNPLSASGGGQSRSWFR